MEAEAPEAAEAPSSAEGVLADLLALTHTLHPDRIAPVLAEHGARLGGADATVYLVDMEQRWLQPLGPGAGDSEPLEIDATLAGRAYRSIQVIDGEAHGGGQRLWVPLLDGAERLGVLGVTVPHVDPLVTRRFRNLATIAAALVVSKSAYGDRLVLTRRRREMDLAAELRWSLLPPLTFSSDRISIAGVLEPAYLIAGDTFDYAVNGDTAHLAIIDAMGHGLEASRMANLAVVSYRHGRRHDLDLRGTFRAMDAVVADQFGEEKFVTGQVATVALPTGSLRWLSAGHPRPLLLRGTTNVSDLECETCLPLGLGDVPGEVAEVGLEPGDRVLFYTDGVVEARDTAGQVFGRDQLADLLVRAATSEEPPPEMLRRLVHAVLSHQGGEPLRDDATLLLVGWPGPS